MNLSFLKKLLPGLIPLLIFIIADEIWGTMVGLYVALGFGVTEFLLIRNRQRNRRFKQEEWFPVVNTDGLIIGKAPRSVCHNSNSRLLHPVVHLHLFNSSGELFLQKRAITKDIQPGKWDTSVGGHIGLGETIENALFREAAEELGLKDFKYRFHKKYVWESSRERELVHSFSTISDEVPVINKVEIEEGRFWSIQEIKKNIGKGVFTPNFEREFEMLISSLGLPPTQ